MGPKPRGVATIAHVADQEGFFGIAHVHFGFKMSVIHHARAEVAPNQGDVCTLRNLNGIGIRGLESKSPKDHEHQDDNGKKRLEVERHYRCCLSW